MRKLSLLLALIMVLSVFATCINAKAINHVATLNNNQPDIDGVIDEGEWEDAVVINIDADELRYYYTNYGSGTNGYWTPEIGLEGGYELLSDSKIYVKTDKDGIYFAFDIADSTPGTAYVKTSGAGAKFNSNGGEGVSVTFKPNQDVVRRNSEGVVRISFAPFADQPFQTARQVKMVVFEDHAYDGDYTKTTTDLTYMVEASCEADENGYVIESFIDWETLEDLGYEVPEYKAGNEVLCNFVIHDAHNKRANSPTPGSYWGVFEIPVNSTFALETDNGQLDGFKVYDWSNPMHWICYEEDSGDVISFTQTFIDLKAGEYYINPIYWAVEKGITNGTSDTTFEPNSYCTRGQIVTFLWRAKGCPEPTTTTNNFVDVKAGEYYEKAVLWAVEKEITDGVDATHFDPNGICTRAQAVTFMYRAAGKPAILASNKFVDIPDGEWFTDAVIWASSLNITNGTDETHFSPDDYCTRGQIVTFLYRDANAIIKTKAVI